MADFEHLVKSFDIGEHMDDIGSAHPPAYLRRGFAKGNSAPRVSWRRVPPLAVCAMLPDAIVDDRDDDFFERELISDWRIHHGARCAKLKDLAHPALTRDQPQDADAVAEFALLQNRLSGAG